MESRDDLERLLLEGLPEDERRLTLASMEHATEVKLARLRQNGLPDEDESFDDFSDSAEQSFA
jgi:hypothetical protein